MKVVNFVYGVIKLEEIQIEVDAYPGFTLNSEFD